MNFHPLISLRQAIRLGNRVVKSIVKRIAHSEARRDRHVDCQYGFKLADGRVLVCRGIDRDVYAVRVGIFRETSRIAKTVKATKVPSKVAPIVW